ncbi:hypothetical protein [Pararhodobacter aggregans]|uniref:Uncharacterized protein n=1 Tax=Pararhodobacter aggregans TaxID=404875 RepID=A0A2T7UVY3_9RHOB|nr:hypothetical protein [Pararhodobacter aggregans]PTX03771.1 hypothetical protein C8N33_10244 [Pararhodobacter aggregans]PVE48741.1 hypothetical protein DDE23_06740 [Pararhodobacter aggregans]
MNTGDLLIWGGAAVTLAGVIGLFACVVYALKVRRAGLEDAAMRKALQRGVVWNMAALFVSVLGLMAVIMGITLG